ncbi:hypothetical protein QQZ08_010079 [Neonectria magnoliae]|uniref:Uncharacterized protein n=1 Tax=Neonectria magnoliae TaxID=2732573 RepID=A0ABR1HJ27_9HYPO
MTTPILLPPLLWRDRLGALQPPQPVNATARTTNSQPNIPVSSSFQNPRRLPAIVSSSFASPTPSTDGPPSSRLRSNRIGGNEPEYSLLELEARLSRDVSQPVQLYFHREWEPRPNGPAAIRFRAGSISHLSCPDDISAAPCVRIEPPVHLFSVQDEIGHPDSPVTQNNSDDDDDDNDSPVTQGDDDDDDDDDSPVTQDNNDNGDNVSDIRDGANITNNRGNTAIRSFPGLYFAVLGLLGVAALPVLLGAADKEMMCSMAMKQDLIVKYRRRITFNLQNIVYESIAWIASGLNSVTTHLMDDLEILESVSVQPTSSRMVAITQPVILAYLKAFDEKVKQETGGYVRELSDGYSSGRTRRNPWAYEDVPTYFASFRNVTKVLSDLCDWFDRLSQMLQLLEKTTVAFGEQLTPLLLFPENQDCFKYSQL